MHITVNKMTASVSVIAVYDEHCSASHIATFEYTHQAARFARKISKAMLGVIVVLPRGSVHASEAFEKGERHDGWALQAVIEGEGV